MASVLSEKDENNLLYQLYVEHVKKQLRDKIQPEVDRVVNQCIDDAVNSLNAQLHQTYDPMTFGKTFKIILENKNL